jgi:hypothetical protein
MGKQPEYSAGLHQILVSVAWDALALFEFGTVKHLITGMALGWDQACAEAAAGLGIPFTAVVPFEGQERVWPQEARTHYQDLLSAAARVVIVPPPKDWSGWTVQALLMNRNTWIVEETFGPNGNADGGRMLALWDGVCRGGTYDTIHKAKDLRLPIDNAWARFEQEVAP